jgi:DNA repair protein RadC
VVLARALLDRDGSVADVASLSVGELTEVRGIGATRACSIVQALQARRGSAS